MNNFNVEEYAKVQSELDHEWIESRSELNNENFSKDGVLNSNEWKNSSPRVLYLLKEMSDGNQRFIRGYDGSPKKAGGQLFWRYINIWNEAISQAFSRSEINYKQAYSKKEDIVKSCSYINIKKFSQNKKKSSNKEIITCAVKDKDFLKRQIQIIKPDIIICGGSATLNSAKAILSLPSGKKIQRIKELDAILIDFYHPSCRKGYQKTFYKLHELLASSTVQDFMNSRNIK